MRHLAAFFLFTSALFAQLPAKDAVRIHEFYRLAPRIEDKIWPGWSATPAPLLLVTADTEYLTRHPHPPAEFKKIADDLYARPRQFPTGLLATFPAFGPPSVIVIGEAENTDAKTSTPWLITLMHEHFHQLQDGQPGFFAATKKLALDRGDTTGMWMLNFPFPYSDPALGNSYAALRDRLLAALNESDDDRFRPLARRYVAARARFFASLAPDDRKYLGFQLWKEGVARYTQIKSAEAAASYQPAAEYVALPDYEPFSAYAAHARSDTLNELKNTNLASWKRTVVYPWGAAEGLFLDRYHPAWKDGYFRNLFTLDPYFQP